MSRNFFSCIDGHTCGNPVRVVISGAPDLQGATMIEKRADFLAHHDWIRKALMFEPRGHDMMSGAILYPPDSDDADVGVLFIETSGCLPMCGHGMIGTVTIAIENDLVKPRHEGRLVMDTPAGRVSADYYRDGEFVDRVRIFNVPSFLAARDVQIECPELGSLKLDIAYGGNYYAIVEPQENYRDLDDLSASDILRLSPIVRELVNKAVDCQHPVHSEIKGVSHVMWTGAPKATGAHGRNAVFYGDHAIDRSPCGTGTSARLAQLVARGEVALGEEFVHESIIGSCFTARAEDGGKVGPFNAILPSIEGWARVTGHNRIVVDDRDPYAHGFQVL